MRRSIEPSCDFLRCLLCQNRAAQLAGTAAYGWAPACSWVVENAEVWKALLLFGNDDRAAVAAHQQIGAGVAIRTADRAVTRAGHRHRPAVSRRGGYGSR